MVKVDVDIDGVIVSFEPDEERNWRAVIGNEYLLNGRKVKKGLLEAVANVMEEITKN